jgi:hypothetical protein
LSLFGLRITSDLNIPWAAEAEPGDADVEIVLALEPSDYDGPGQSFGFEVPGVAHYRIDDGRRITIAPIPGASEDALRLYLAGSAFGVLLHQRGHFVLHANSVVLDGAAFLFMGVSGAGKSTLAGWFSRSGFAVLADDVSPIAMNGGPPLALPGLPRLRLDSAAIESLGLAVAPSIPCAASGKHELALSPPPPAPVPIGGLYLLSDDPEAVSASIARVQGSEAVEMLMANTYRGFVLHGLGQSGAHFSACLQLAATVPCSRVARRRDWSQLDEVGEKLVQDMRGLAARRP